MLLSALRDSLQLNFGDAALGAALASLQGAPLSRDSRLHARMQTSLTRSLSVLLLLAPPRPTRRQ